MKTHFAFFSTWKETELAAMTISKTDTEVPDRE